MSARFSCPLGSGSGPRSFERSQAAGSHFSKVLSVLMLSPTSFLARLGVSLAAIRLRRRDCNVDRVVPQLAADCRGPWSRHQNLATATI